MHSGLELTLFKDLLLDDILVQDLVVELEWLLVDELVVKTLAVCGLHNVAFRVNAILVALLSGSLVLTFELFFLLDGVRMVLHKALRWADLELHDASVVQLVNRLVKSLWVDTLSLVLKLAVKFSELVLDSFRLELKLFIVEPVLRLSIDSKLLFVRVIKRLFSGGSVFFL